MASESVIKPATWYPWLTEPYKQLVAQYSSGREHHALLLHIPEEYGADLLTFAVGRWLMCQQPQGEKTCGQCRGCQLMSAGNHPDWYEISPEGNRVTLGVEQIRQLTDKLYEHAQQGGAKVVWLANTELLTESAANALLKTLEEPPKQTYFLLGCHEPAKLLATIRSRCLYWPLTNPNEEYSSQWLNKQQVTASGQDCITALRLTNHSPLKALRLLQQGGWQQRLALCDSFLQALHQADLLSLLPALNQDNVIERLDWLLSLLADAMKYLQGANQFMVNQDQLPLIQLIARQFQPIILQQMSQQWLECRRQLIGTPGVNKELLLTNLLLQTETAYCQ